MRSFKICLFFSFIYSYYSGYSSSMFSMGGSSSFGGVAGGGSIVIGVVSYKDYNIGIFSILGWVIDIGIVVV